MRKALFPILALCAVLTGCGPHEHGLEHESEHRHEHSHDHIEVSPERQEKLGIRVETVSEAPFSEVIRTSGQVVSSVGDEMTVVAIVLPKALRRKRLAERPERPFTAQQVAERDTSEIENLEKGGPIAIADYYVDNSGTIQEFHERFGQLMKEIKFID